MLKLSNTSFSNIQHRYCPYATMVCVWTSIRKHTQAQKVLHLKACSSCPCTSRPSTSACAAEAFAGAAATWWWGNAVDATFSEAASASSSAVSTSAPHQARQINFMCCVEWPKDCVRQGLWKCKGAIDGQPATAHESILPTRAMPTTPHAVNQIFKRCQLAS